MYRNAWELHVLVLLRLIAVHGFADVLAVHFQGPRTRRELRTPAAVVARERLAQRALPRVEGLGSSEQRADGIDLHGGGQRRGKLLRWSAPGSPSGVERFRGTAAVCRPECVLPAGMSSLHASSRLPAPLCPFLPHPSPTRHRCFEGALAAGGDVVAPAAGRRQREVAARLQQELHLVRVRVRVTLTPTPTLTLNP